MVVVILAIAAIVPIGVAIVAIAVRAATAAIVAIAATAAIAAIAAIAGVRPAILENRSGKYYAFRYFTDPNALSRKARPKTSNSVQFSLKCVFGPRLRSPNRFRKKTQKHNKIENVEIGALVCIIRRPRKAIIRRKCVWATPAQSKIAESASGPRLRSPK